MDKEATNRCRRVDVGVIYQCRAGTGIWKSCKYYVEHPTFYGCKWGRFGISSWENITSCYCAEARKEADEKMIINQATKPLKIGVCELLNANPDIKAVVDAILEEYLRACNCHPAYPDDVVFAASIVVEEAGELLKEANDIRFDIDTVQRRENLQTEAIQTGAMAIRFLMEIGNLKGAPAP